MFRILGVAKWDRYRTLCARCYRRALERAPLAAAEIPARAEPSPVNHAAVA
jgi:hypothetical protein